MNNKQQTEKNNNEGLKEHICNIVKEINNKDLLQRIYRYVIFIESKK